MLGQFIAIVSLFMALAYAAAGALVLVLVAWRASVVWADSREAFRKAALRGLAVPLIVIFAAVAGGAVTTAWTMAFVPEVRVEPPDDIVDPEYLRSENQAASEALRE